MSTAALELAVACLIGPAATCESMLHRVFVRWPFRVHRVHRPMTNIADAISDIVPSVPLVYSLRNNRLGAVHGLYDCAVEVSVLCPDVELTARCQLDVDRADLIFATLHAIFVQDVNVNVSDAFGETTDDEAQAIADVGINSYVLAIVVDIDFHGHEKLDSAWSRE